MNIITTEKSSLFASQLFTQEIADEWLEYLKSEILPVLDKHPQGIAFGKSVTMHRNIGFFSDTSKGYKFTKHMFHSNKLSQFSKLQHLLSQINVTLGTKYNGILINSYQGGADYISQHADDEKELDPSAKVAAISFGSPRIFRVTLNPKCKYAIDVSYAQQCLNKKCKLFTVDVPTEHGQLLIMNGNFQHEFLHGIPASTQISENSLRFSLTFRYHTE